MKLLASLLVAAVAAIHVYIVILEMVLWQKPFGLRAFRLTPEQAAQTATLAKNQGLYNGFLVAGLGWALVEEGALRRAIATFFLGCVVVAGLFGAATVSRRILFIQSFPAALALVALWMGA